MRPLGLGGVLLTLLIACQGASPPREHVLQHRALTAWREGEAHLREGRAAAALEAFERALESQPADPLLLAWRARAQADSGDLQAAIASLRTVLAKEPGLAEARYNLAAYLVRAGDRTLAAQALQRALRDGARDPRDVLTDPDFAAVLDAPEFAFLPRAPLDVTLKGPGGSVFVGSDAIVHVAIAGLELDGVVLSMPPIEGPLRLWRIEERLETSADGDQRLSLTWSLRVEGAAQVPVGPLEVSAGPRMAQAEGLTLVTLAPEDHEGAPARRLTLMRATDLASTAPDPGAWAWRKDDRLFARVRPGERVVRDDEVVADLRVTRVEERDEQWTLHVWNDSAPDRRLRLRRGGKVLDEVVR